MLRHLFLVEDPAFLLAFLIIISEQTPVDRNEPDRHFVKILFSMDMIWNDLQAYNIGYC